MDNVETTETEEPRAVQEIVNDIADITRSKRVLELSQELVQTYDRAVFSLSEGYDTATANETRERRLKESGELDKAVQSAINKIGDNPKSQ